MNVKRPSVSVIIPHYNQNECLQSCIASISSQLDENDEIIIVDDSSRHVPVIVTGDWIPAVRLVELSENCGPGAVRNIGVEKAKHDYVAFLDADDIALTGRILAQLHALNSNPDWVGCVGDYIYQRGEKDNPPSVRGQNEYFNVRQSLISGRIFAAGSTLMVKRQWFLEVGGYNPALRVYEDWDLLLRMILRSTVGHCGMPLAIISPSTRRASKDDRLRALMQLSWTHAGHMPRREYRSFMQALAYERASAYFRARWIWSGLCALLTGSLYAPITLLRRITARLVSGLP